MWAIVWSWIISAVVILALAVAVGWVVTKRLTGLLIDGRGRYSLTHLQITSWSVVILSLIAGAAIGRLQHGLDPLAFDVPGAVLAVLGISLGSGVLSAVAKSTKDNTHPEKVAASMPLSERTAAGMTPAEDQQWKPKFRQVYMQEEGTFADRVVDITKFQNFIITVVLIVVYVAAVIRVLDAKGTAAGFASLPDFSGTFLALLGISHGAYLAGKLPPQAGEPDHSLEERNAMIKSASTSSAARETAAPT